jgi:AraC-like DNA-binding protein
MNVRTLGPPKARHLRKVGTLVGFHYHDELEFISVAEGKIRCTVYGVDYEAGPGEIIFVNSRVPHMTEVIEPSRTGLLQFRESDFHDSEVSKVIKYSMRFRPETYYPAKVIKSPELFDTIESLFIEQMEKREAHEVFIKSYILRILGILYREGILSDAERVYNMREVQKILPILSYINQSYAENITLEDASERLNFDPSYFCRIFKTATGATFTEYLNFVRISKAEKMLSKTRQSILEISEAVGFSSVSYFTRIFKKYRSCSPRVYRTAKYSPNE